MSELRPIAAVVAAITRAVRALGYYDAAHPMFEQARAEVRLALERAAELHPRVTLGSGGAHLVVDAEGSILEDEPSAVLARRMFRASIVAISLEAGSSDRDLGALIALLAESAERIRDAGGARAIFAPEDPQRTSVVDVDFAAIFTGGHGELAELTGGDPIAELALRHALRFKEDESAEGEALGISLEKLATVDSLGDFLDGLLDRAEPGVVAKRTRPPAAEATARVSADELADLASRAYSVNQRRLSAGPGEAAEAELARSAQVLADTLVRLSPDARFALLRKLAGADELASMDDRAALERLGGQLDNKLIVEAVAGALVEHRGDSDAVRAIGNLIRRLRPVEADRLKLLASIDRGMAVHHTRLDGALWQEMQAKALENSALGMLELDVRARQEQLAAITGARLRGERPPIYGEEILHAQGRAIEDRHGANALAELLGDARPIPAAILDSIRSLIEDLDDAGAGEASLALIRALMKRADGDGGGGAAAALLRELLVGSRGGERTAKLARLPGGQTLMTGEILLRAFDGPGDRAFKDQLLDRLAGFDTETLHALGGNVAEADPHRVGPLLRAALRADRKLGVKLARTALKNPHHKSKEAAIRALAESPDKESLGLLAGLAGWKGDRVTRALTAGPRAAGTTEARLFELQRLAIEVLGAARSPLAIGALGEMLERQSLISSKPQEELRAAVARALAAIGTREALAVLEAGVKHKKRAIREACTRALGTRSSSRDR